MSDPAAPLKGHRQLSIHPPRRSRKAGPREVHNFLSWGAPSHTYLNLKTDSMLPPGQGQRTGVFEGGNGRLWLEEETYPLSEIQQVHSQGHSLETNPLYLVAVTEMWGSRGITGWDQVTHLSWPRPLGGFGPGPGEGTEAEPGPPLERQVPGWRQPVCRAGAGHAHIFVFTCVYVDKHRHGVHRIYKSPQGPI